MIVEKVKCMTFSALLEKQCKKNRSLHIDTEGYDYEIIKSIDFSQIKPRMIYYEHWCFNSDIEECSKYLEDKGYRLIQEYADTLAIVDVSVSKITSLRHCLARLHRKTLLIENRKNIEAIYFFASLLLKTLLLPPSSLNHSFVQQRQVWLMLLYSVYYFWGNTLGAKNIQFFFRPRASINSFSISWELLASVILRSMRVEDIIALVSFCREDCTGVRITPTATVGIPPDKAFCYSVQVPGSGLQLGTSRQQWWRRNIYPLVMVRAWSSSPRYSSLTARLATLGFLHSVAVGAQDGRWISLALFRRLPPS